jgi:hypothetical protein
LILHRSPSIALIVILLFGSTPWTDLCASRSSVPDCCRGKACPMAMHNATATCAIGGCDDQETAKSADARVERAIAIELPVIPSPRSADVHFAMLEMHPLDGIAPAPHQPPRIVSFSR